jgi:hypothetical protein
MGQHGRGVVMAYRSPLENIHGRPIGQPHLEVQAPVTFPLPSVASSFAKPPVWPPPSVDEAHAAMTESAEVTHRMVATLLDRSNGPKAPMLLKDAFSTLFAKLDRPSDNANLDLIAELVDLRGRIVARLEEQRDDTLSVAKAAHQTIFSQCRLAKDTRDKLVNELNAATSYAQAIAFEPLSQAKSALATAEGAKPRREDFPSEQELEDWWSHVLEERNKLAAVEARYSTQLGVAERLQKELAAAQVEFDRLTAKEAELSARAENRPTRLLGVEVAVPLSEI